MTLSRSCASTACALGVDTGAAAAGEGADRVYSTITWRLGADIEQLYLTGSGSANAIGNGLDNVLVGNSRGNVIVGGAGRDLMTGGAGADRFDFDAVSESTLSASDRIADLAAEDVIDLSTIDANSLVAGNQAFTLVSAFTGAAGQLTLTYNARGGFTVLDADINGDRVADFRVLLTGDHSDYDNFRL